MSRGLSRAQLRGLCGISLTFLLVGLVGCGATAPQARRRPPLLSIERKKQPQDDYFPYVVQRGDTLYGLGKRFGVPWQEIAGDNDIEDVSGLGVGRLLTIRRVEGVRVPELVLAEPTQEAEPPRHRLSQADLHHGKSSSRFWWPTKGRVVRHYGDKVRGLPEPGIGISAPAGTDVCAAAAGAVVTCVRVGPPPASAWGNVVAIGHAGNMVSWYAHLDRIFVTKGRKVSQGETIGTVGSSGAADRPILAFRIFRNELPVNPEDHLP